MRHFPTLVGTLQAHGVATVVTESIAERTSVQLEDEPGVFLEHVPADDVITLWRLGGDGADERCELARNPDVETVLRALGRRPA